MKFEYVGNLGGLKPLIKLVKFAAGSGTTVEPGDACLLGGGVFAPITSDTAMTAGVAIAQERITVYHLAGYYPALIPQPGDLFKATLASASAADRGQNVFITAAAQTLATSGSNQFGDVVDHAGFPLEQGDPTVGDVADRGTTIQSVTTVFITIKAANSYLAALQT
jgi:hypothetical protein